MKLCHNKVTYLGRKILVSACNLLWSSFFTTTFVFFILDARTAVLWSSEFFLSTQGAQPDGGVSIVADQISVEEENKLVAKGNVKVSYKGGVLEADEIIYTQADDMLRVNGPIKLISENGDVLLAEKAELSSDMSEGIVHEARALLDGKLQIAAKHAHHSDGLIGRLENVIASSCRICKGSKTPLWEVRSKSVSHDQENRRLRFQNARFRVFGIPVIYTPGLSIPHLDVKRASGFLRPNFHSTTGLGSGVRVPYFWALDASHDLTLTPYAALKGLALEARYRQAFHNGNIELNGAVVRDKLVTGLRYYLAAKGTFNLPRDYILSFGRTYVSDPLYLHDYDLEVRDKLFNITELLRVKRLDYVQGRVIDVKTLRAADRSATSALFSGSYYRRSPNEPVLGGDAGVLFEVEKRYRDSNAPATSVDSDADGIVNAGQVNRVLTQLDWRRRWFLKNGIIVTLLAEGNAAYYHINEVYKGNINTTRFSLGSGIQLRWPFHKVASSGARHLIQPVVQFSPARIGRRLVITEDSRSPELDEGNFLLLDRFPGSDVLDYGNHLSLGTSYTLITPSGNILNTTLAKILRREDQSRLPFDSGLSDQSPGWLASLALNAPSFYNHNAQFMYRMLVDDRIIPRKSELKLILSTARYGVTTTYIWLEGGSSEVREVMTSRALLDGNYTINNQWVVTGGINYDFHGRKADSMHAGFIFHNECLIVDASATRQFTSAPNLRKTTKFNVKVDFPGFGSSSKGRKVSACKA